MDYLNSHIHLDGINSERLEQMYFSGIRELVSPAMSTPAIHGEGVSLDTINETRGTIY